MQAQTASQNQLINTIHCGDCIEVMRAMFTTSVDFILTDPPYLVNFRDRTGRTLRNDANSDWLRPAMAEAYRVLKNNRLMLCFYGWPRAEEFLEAWREAGFRPLATSYFASHTPRRRRTFSGISTNRRIC
jgi:site-specific DNA-methyltransferase (adenine-specific)